MSQATTIDLGKDLEQADEQAQLRAALRRWLDALGEFPREGNCPPEAAYDELDTATEDLETVARRLEGM